MREDAQPNVHPTDPRDEAIQKGSDHKDYQVHKRSPRVHRRVVLKGTERFDADGVKLEAGDMQTKKAKNADDDARILGELPPHWGVFSAEKE